MKLDSLRSESALEQIRQLEVETHGNARQKFEHCHFATEAVPNRAQLEPDRACADNEKLLWRLSKTERFSAANDSLNIVIATGSVPIELPFAKFDGQKIVSSTEALCFTEAPKKFLVIGAGAIGLELGSVWNRLGSEVTMLEFLPRIAVGFDLELSNLLQRALTAQGIKFHLETKVTGVKVENGHVIASAEKANEKLTFEADKVLVSVGRKPFSEGLGAEKVGVEFDERKRIKIDKHFRTNVEGIYAIGDVIAGPMLAHKAEDEGIACAEIIAGKAGHVNYDAIAGVIYTNPELAGVGLTEDQAKEKGIDYGVGKFPFRANSRALCNEDIDGMVKFVVDAKTDRILGAHILQHAASELIAEAVSVIEFGGSSEDIGRTCHSHPDRKSTRLNSSHS